MFSPSQHRPLLSLRYLLKNCVFSSVMTMYIIGKNTLDGPYASQLCPKPPPQKRGSLRTKNSRLLGYVVQLQYDDSLPHCLAKGMPRSHLRDSCIVHLHKRAQRRPVPFPLSLLPHAFLSWRAAEDPPPRTPLSATGPGLCGWGRRNPPGTDNFAAK